MSFSILKARCGPSLFRFLESLGIFVIVLTATKLGEYIFFEWNTAPVILWPAAGFSSAFIWLYGYRAAIPVFLGFFVALATGYIDHTPLQIVGRAMLETSSSLVVVFLLRYFGFTGSFSNLRSQWAAFQALLLASFVEPLVGALVSPFTVYGYTTWGYVWAGHLLSGLIIFPLIVSWMRPRTRIYKRPLYESIIVGVLLVISVASLLWIQFPIQYSFFLFTIFFMTFFWIGFRFSTRALTLALALISGIGIFALFIIPSTESQLNEKILAAEFLLFTIIPVFYTISALAKERSHTIEELKRAMEKIERESIAKNDFIAVLAHELRNPLAPIKSTLEILDLSDLDPDIKNLVNRSQQQVRVMQRLLSDLLDITRVTQGRFEIRVSNVNLRDLIRQCIDSVQYVFKDRKHTISLVPESDPDLWLSVDPVRFQQVIVNLLMNAAKYTDPGGKITISTHVVDGRVQIAVQDNGIGIGKDHIQHVFEPFWQLTKTRRSLTGIGIGLWLTKRIVEMHGGEIAVYSEGKGKGSVFTVTVPILVVEQPLASETLSRKEDSPRQRILICDDNQPAADALAKLLSIKGHETKVVYAGNEVLEEVERYQPDIVLLDIGLSDTSGYVVAQELRAQGFRKKILALSGYGQEEDKREALKAGFDHHFTKPMSLEAFEKYIRSIS